MSAVGVGIGVDRVVASSWYEKLAPRIIKKPKIYFIQLGFEAKLKSLNVIDVLRKAKIPIAQSLSKDSLGSQLAVAEKLNVPLLGQIPLVQSICEAGDAGRPAVLQENTPQAMALMEMAKNVAQQIAIRNAQMEATKKVELIK